MTSEVMVIHVEVPADDYVLLSKKDLGRLVALLQAKGVWEDFQGLDIKVRGISYVDPRVRLLASRLTDVQERALDYMTGMVSSGPLVRDPFVYQGKDRIRGVPGVTRRTLDALAKMELAEMREMDLDMMKGPFKVPTSGFQGYYITDLGREVLQARKSA